MKPELVQRINAEFSKALQSPDTMDRLARLGVEPGRGLAADFAAMIAKDSAHWAQLIRDRKITSE